MTNTTSVNGVAHGSAVTLLAIAPEMCAAMAAHFAAPSGPELWARVAHAIDPSCVPHPALRLVLETVQQIASGPGARAPTDIATLAQQLRKRLHEGKVTQQEVDAVFDLLALGHTAPPVDEVVGVLAPVVKHHLHTQAIILSHKEFARKGDFANVQTLLEAAARIGEPASADTRLEATDMLDGTLDAIDYLVRDYGICPGAPTLLSGYGYTGKSLFGQALAVAVASGRLAFGSLWVRQGRALWLDYEQGRPITASRFRRLAAADGIGSSDLQGKLSAIIQPRQKLDAPGARGWLARQAEHHALVVVDSFRAACPATDENSASEVRSVLDMLGAVSEQTGATILVIHHATKVSQGGPEGKYRTRGSGAFFDGAGNALRLEEDGSLHHDKDRARGVLERPTRLTVEDVLIGAEVKGGLRVQLAAPQTGSGQGLSLEAQILQVVQTQPGITKNQAAQTVGGRRTAAMAAIQSLLASGQVTMTTKGRSDCLMPAQSAPAVGTVGAGGAPVP